MDKVKGIVDVSKLEKIGIEFEGVPNGEEHSLRGWLNFYIFNGKEWVAVSLTYMRRGAKSMVHEMHKAITIDLWRKFTEMMVAGKITVWTDDHNEVEHEVYAVSKYPFDIYFTSGGKDGQ